MRVGLAHGIIRVPALLVLVSCAPAPRHPSDREMIEHFHSHRAQFEAYAAYHKTWATAWKDSVAWLSFPERMGMAMDRDTERARLERLLDLDDGGGLDYVDGARIAIRSGKAIRRGLRRDVKGYEYFDSSPPRLYDDLDRLDLGTRPANPWRRRQWLRHIEGHWYLVRYLDVD